MVICHDAAALAAAMNSDAVYSSAAQDAQKNLNLEFSDAHGEFRYGPHCGPWVARELLAMVERHCALARRIAEGLRVQATKY